MKKKLHLLEHNPALEPNMNFADIFLRYNLMIAFGFLAVFLKIHILFFVCIFLLFEGMMGWCVTHYLFGINHHRSKR